MLTAFIWGTAFVAQKIGSGFVSPFYYNCFRFLLGFVVLLFFAYFFGKKSKIFTRKNLRCGAISGLFLFSGATLQQFGIQYTTTGSAGFITGLYVVLVPFLGIFFGKKAGKAMWIGCFLAFWGLYFLAVKDFGGQINFGDFLVFLCAICFAFHVVSIDIFLASIDALVLSLLQFLVCGLLSLVCAGIFESVSYAGVRDGFWAIFYAGVFSVGLAYTLQVVGQKMVEPTPAAIILSFETVFAALGGYFILGESITPRGQIGCVFMLTGIVVSQIKGNIIQKVKK